MFEVATTQTHRDAIERAHKERAEAFAQVLSLVSRPFRIASWPQVSARRLQSQPQG